MIVEYYFLFPLLNKLQKNDPMKCESYSRNLVTLAMQQRRRLYKADVTIWYLVITIQQVDTLNVINAPFLFLYFLIILGDTTFQLGAWPRVAPVASPQERH